MQPVEARTFCMAFGKDVVAGASQAVHDAPRLLLDGHLADPKSIGTMREDPCGTFKEILVRKDPKGYVRAILCFDKKLDTPQVLDQAYQEFIAAHQEAAVLEAAQTMSKGQTIRVRLLHAKASTSA